MRGVEGHRGWIAVAAVAVAAGLLATPASAAGPDRFSFAGGCHAVESLQVDRFVVRDGSGYAATASRSGADPFLMKASALGRYLFHGQDRDLIATGLASSVVAAEDPRPIEVGDPRSALRASARELGRGLWVERGAGRDRPYVYATGGGRVTAVGVATRRASRDPGTLSAYRSELR